MHTCKTFFLNLPLLLKKKSMETKNRNVVYQTASPVTTRVLPFIFRNTQNNSLNVIYIFKTLQYFLRIFGLQKVSISGRKVKKTRGISATYSITLALAIFSVQSYAVYYRTVHYYNSMEFPSILVDLLNLIPSTVTAIVSLIFSATKYQPIFIRLLHNFVSIDHHLNIPLDKVYLILRKKVTIFLTFIIVTSIVTNLYDYFMWKGDTRISMSSVLMTIKELTLLEVSIYFYLIIIRFDNLNVQLKGAKYESPNIYLSEVIKIDRKRNSVIKRMGKIYFEGNEGVRNQENLSRLMIIFDKLADNVNIINSCFGLTVNICFLLWDVVFVIFNECCADVYTNNCLKKVQKRKK